MQKGKFIVIEGADGAGKATQTKRLVTKLKKEGYKVKTIDFPQYETSFFGKFIGECLRGEYGDFISLDPHVVSVFYACDRRESSSKIQSWLEKGYIVIADRYTGSNQIHQGGKIEDEAKRMKFMEWLKHMEYDALQNSKPDLMVYLDIDFKTSKKLLKLKETKTKHYLKGKKDIAEENEHHQIQTRKTAKELCTKYDDWIAIPCMKGGNLLSKDDVADLVWEVVEKEIK